MTNRNPLTDVYTGEAPPMALEQAEITLLYCITVLPDVLSELSSWLHPDDFCMAQWRDAYWAAQALQGRGETVNAQTILTELIQAQIPYNSVELAKIIDPVPGQFVTAAGYETYAHIIKEASRKRQFDNLLGKLNTEGRKDASARKRLISDLMALDEEQSGTKPRFVLLTYEDLQTRPPVEFFQGGLIQKGGLNVLYGRSGTGKTTIALSVISLPIAQDEMVIYVAGEGAGGFADRIAAWKNVHHKTSGKFRLIEQPPTISDSADVTTFIAVIAPLKPALIVIDTLSCSIGGDENATADMTKFVNACNRMQRETGSAILVIHHTGKDESRGARGAIVLRDRADVMIELTDSDGLIRLTCDKTRDAAPFEPRQFELVETDARPGNRAKVAMPSDRIVHTDADELTKNQRKMLETLALPIYAETGATHARLWRAANVPEGSADKVLSALKDRGYIRQSDKGEPYFITEAGKRKLTPPSLPSNNHHDGNDDADNYHHYHHTPLGVMVGDGVDGSSIEKDQQIIEGGNRFKTGHCWEVLGTYGVSADSSGPDLVAVYEGLAEAGRKAYGAALAQAGLYDRFEQQLGAGG